MPGVNRGVVVTAALERAGVTAVRMDVGAEQAPPPDKVVRAVWRALNARRPRSVSSSLRTGGSTGFRCGFPTAGSTG